MSKYDSLWQYVADCGKETLTLTFAQIGEIAGVPLNHSFLRYKKELAGYGYEVGKISMKEETVTFEKCEAAH